MSERARYDGGGRAICLHECLQSVLSVRMILPENLDFIN